MNKSSAAVLSQPLRFNFHDLVAVEVDTDREEDAAFFAAEYGHHQSGETSAVTPVVVLRFRRGSSLPDGFTFHQHKLLARWGYQMRLSAGRIELNVTGNRLAAAMVHHMLLHPSLRYLSAQRGNLLLHAGAVANAGKSLIFTGYGGTGKTTTTSLVLAGGGASWSPHGDDYIFISSGPRSLAYVTRAHLYRDLLRWVPEIGERLSLGERLRLEVFSAIRRWSRDGLKWAVRLPIERLWPGRAVEMSAEPAAIVLLGRSPDKAVQRPVLSPVPADEAPVDQLISMNFYEARHFLNLVEKSRAVPDFPSWLKAWQECERDLLRQRLGEIPAYQLELPDGVGAPAAMRSELVKELAGLITGVNRG